MRAVYWTAVFIVAVVLSLVAASNRESVSLALWPLPFLVEAPLYLAVFLALLGGFVGGVIVARIAGRHRRRELRRCRRRSEALARELAMTQSQLATEVRPSTPALPATR
jgi:putative membrane protein